MTGAFFCDNITAGSDFMKKIISIILTLSLTLSLFLLSGCKDDGVKTITIKLKANATTGYKWNWIASPNGIVKIEGKYEQDEAKAGMVGVGGTQVYTVTGLKKGTTTIDFTYEAPGTREISLVAKYVITVDKKMNLKEVSHTGSYFEQDNIEPSTVFVVKLPCDKAAGYTWSCNLDKKDLAKVTEDYRPNGYIKEVRIVEEETPSTEEKTEDEDEDSPLNGSDIDEPETDDEDEDTDETVSEPETVTTYKDDGSGGLQIFAIEGKKSGEIVLKFTYKKEGDENPTYEAVYRLNIDDKNIITEISHTGSYFNKK